MKTMNYSVIRGICAIIMGVLLVTWPESAIVYLVIAIGAMFLVPSLFSLVGYFVKGRQGGMMFPIVSLGSLLFGLWHTFPMNVNYISAHHCWRIALRNSQPISLLFFL